MFPSDPPLRRAWLLIFALAAVVRLVHLAQLVDSPALAWHLWPQTDMHAFWVWSGNIAGGDFLSRLPQRPLTGWHLDVARLYLQLVPDAALTSLPAQEAATQLWHTWQGGARFYQEPVYPYLLALLRGTLGLGALGLIAAQMLLGLAGLWLLMDGTRRLAGDRAAVLAGLLATCCGPLVYYESLMLRESLTVTLVWWLVRQWAVARDRTEVAPWLAMGAVAGLTMLTRAATLPFVVLLALWSLRLVTAQPQALRHRALGWSLGLAGPLSLLAARNLAVGESPLAIAGGGVFAFVAANAPGADPSLGLVLDPPILARLLAGSHGNPLALAWHTVEAQGAGMPALVWAKLVALIQPAEIPNNSNFLFFSAHTPILRWLAIGWALILPLSLIGAWLSLRHRALRIWVLFAALQVGFLLVTQPLSRYRIVLLAGLIPLAALAGAHLTAQVQAGLRPRQIAPWVGAVLSAAGLGLLALPPVCLRPADHAVAWQFWAEPRIRAAAERSDLPAVVDSAALFLRGQPTSWQLPRDTATVRLYARASEVLADALDAQGNASAAQEQRAMGKKLLAILGTKSSL